MLKLLSSYLRIIFLYPAARVIVWWKSEKQRLKTLGQPSVLHFEEAYDGRQIMILALYEKGELRPDVVTLLRAAQKQGLYIVAVNTLCLSSPDSIKDLVNCYIERPNFGRDFGSYKTGFLHVFERGWQKACPRLLMINDSIFFSEARMPGFLSDMMTSDIEALGSTENYEIEHHLGSFCIAIGQSVLQHNTFQAYWKSYSLSDIRPRVIKRGEMGLSKVLRYCVSSPRQFQALYSTARFLSEVRNSEGLMDFMIKNARTSDLTGWEQVNAKEISKALEDRFISLVNLRLLDEEEDINLQARSPLSDINKAHFVQDIASLKSFLMEHVENSDAVDPDVMDDMIISELGRVFMSGSQIHQNAAILLKLGLPIVKLDGMYRGMFNLYDVQRVCAQLRPEEAIQLKEILLERPFGGDTLVGWRRAAFMVGLI